MPRWLYPILTEPVQVDAAPPETITADKWQPVYPQPSRRIPFLICLTVAAAVGPLSTDPETVTADRWEFSDPQPVRTERRAPWLGQHVHPLSVDPETVTADRWEFGDPQPDRTERRSPWLGSHVAPLSTDPETVTVDRWKGTTWQPDRTEHRSPWLGTVYTAPVSTSPETVTADRWEFGDPQPDRTPWHLASRLGWLVCPGEPIVVPVVVPDIPQQDFPQPDRTRRIPGWLLATTGCWGPFTSPVVLSPEPLTLRPRSAALTLEARADTLTLRPRSTALTLPEI